MSERGNQSGCHERVGGPDRTNRPVHGHQGLAVVKEEPMVAIFVPGMRSLTPTDGAAKRPRKSLIPETKQVFIKLHTRAM
jgi:hypothetical protein